jgi:hypothetical protein
MHEVNAYLFRKKAPRRENLWIVSCGIEEVVLESQPLESHRLRIPSSCSDSAGKDLFNALATALNKDDQHNDREDGGNNANKC